MRKPRKEDLILIPVVIFGVVMIVLTIITYHGKSETSVIEETTVATDSYQEQIDALKNEVSRLESKIDAMSTTTTTTTTSTETTTTTTSVTTTTTSVTTTTTQTTTTTTATASNSNNLTSLGTFTGTYYSGRTVPCRGGSGRTLIDCTVGSSGVKGSVASRLVYRNYGYNRDGERTKIYIEFPTIPSMNGWYYVDDCNSRNDIIDFYFYYNRNCPWQQAGVITVKAYI